MTKSVIVAAARTALGSFQGSLAPVKSTALGAMVIKEVIRRAGIESKAVSDVIMGCVLPAGLGQAPARQAALGANLPTSVNVMTINKVCGSGMRSVMLADQMIRAGDAEVVVAGGMESMTNSPYLMPAARGGFRMGDNKVVDSMVHDGLWDIYSNQHMGMLAEMCAEKYGFTRELQDEFAIQSYKKAQSAIAEGSFKEEIVAVEIPQKKGDALVFEVDEEPARAKFDKFAVLKPAFKKDGTVTAANSSSISDGAAALLVMSEKRAKKDGLPILAHIESHASFSQEPEWFTTAPIGACRLAMEKAGVKVNDIDLFEINEAFSVVTLAAIRELMLDASRVNVNGGAVALGHPIGVSGARILTTLLYAMKHRDAKRGLATLCIGGGEGTAMIVGR